MSAPYPFRCLILAAVSKPSQAAADKYSIPEQLKAGHAVVEAREWIVAGESVIPGHSRSYEFLDELTADCPEYAQVMRTIRSGDIDLVVVRHEDRLWRTMDLQQQVTAVCRRHKVQIFDINSPREPVRPDLLHVKALDKLIGAISGFKAESDNETRMERVYANLQTRITERGLNGNWARGIYGYDCSDTSQPPPQVPEEVRWIRRMGELRMAGRSYAAIFRELDRLDLRTGRGQRWSAYAVRYILSNEFYAGTVSWGDARGQGRHEAVFTPEEWERIQAVNREHSRFALKPQGRYEFSSLCGCAICHRAMAYHHSRRLDAPGSRPYLECIANKRLADSLSANGHPHTNNVPEEWLRDRIIARLQRELADPAMWLAAREAQREQTSAVSIEGLDKEIAGRQLQWQRWDDGFERGAIGLDEMLGHRQRIIGAVEKLQAERERLVQADIAAGALRQNVVDVSAALEMLPAFSWEERRRVYGLLIKRIWLDHHAEPVVDWR